MSISSWTWICHFWFIGFQLIDCYKQASMVTFISVLKIFICLLLFIIVYLFVIIVCLYMSLLKYHALFVIGCILSHLTILLFHYIGWQAESCMAPKLSFQFTEHSFPTQISCSETNHSKYSKYQLRVHIYFPYAFCCPYEVLIHFIASLICISFWIKVSAKWGNIMLCYSGLKSFKKVMSIIAKTISRGVTGHTFFYLDLNAFGIIWNNETHREKTQHCISGFWIFQCQNLTYFLNAQLPSQIIWPVGESNGG